MKKISTLLALILTIGIKLSAQNCSDLFISEYVEGTGFNKAIEIYNPTSAPITLSDYKVMLYSFSATGTTPSISSLTLTGTIAANGTHIIAHGSADSLGIRVKAQQISNSIANFNGNDAVVLVKISTADTLDVFGNRFTNTGTYIMADGDSTQNRTLVRKLTVQKGTKLYSQFITEWVGYAINDTTHLGSHSSTCGGAVIDTLVSFSPLKTSTVAENVGIVNLKIKLSQVVSQAYSVPVTLVSGDTSDINGFNGTTVNFAAGTDTASVNVSVTDDLLTEGADTLIFKLNGISTLKLGADSLYTLIISLSDPVDTSAYFTPISSVVQESIGTVKLNVKLSQAPTQASTLDVVLTSGDSADISGFLSNTVNFAAGVDTATVTISVTDDLLYEQDDTLKFTLRNPSSSVILGADSVYTLVIKLSDFSYPLYTISTVRGSNTAGRPDSVGITCRIRGVVYGNNMTATANNLQFTIRDASSGIQVYSTKNFGYTPVEGDSVEVTGRIGWWQNLSGYGTITISNDTLIKLGTGATLKTPTVVSTILNETTESDLIRINNLKLVVGTTWNTSGSTAYTAKAYRGTDTFNIRVNTAIVTLLAASKPNYVFDVIGIGGQNPELVAPWDSNYTIQPRYAADILPHPFVVPTYTIGQVRGNNTNGIPDSNGIYCKIRGVVYGLNARTSGLQFTFRDNTGGMGIFSASKTYGYAVTEGDSVEVTGTVGVFRGLAQISIDTLLKLSSSIPLKTPTVVSTPLGETTESDLIRLNNLFLVNVNQWITGSATAFNVDVTDGTNTYSARIQGSLLTEPKPASKFDLIGIGSQFATTSNAPFADGYQIIPRYKQDIIPNNSAISSIGVNNIQIISGVDVLPYIYLDASESKIFTVQVYNALGDKISSELVNTNIGKTTIALKDNYKYTGVYFISVLENGNVITVAKTVVVK